MSHLQRESLPYDGTCYNGRSVFIERHMANTITQPRRPRVFYGYWLIVVTFIFLVLCIGCGSFAFSLFVRPLEASFGWGRGQVMAGFTIFFVTMGVASPLIGRFVDRYGARPVIPVGAVIMGLGFVLVSRMSHLWLFYLSYAIIGIGGAGIGQVPCSAIISNWFKKRRGTAIGLMSAGVGAGGFAIAPVVGWLIPEFGWRTAYLSMAFMVWAVAIPLSLLVVRTRPAEIGLYPDGDSKPPELRAGAAGRASEAPSFTLKEAARTSTFWLVAVSYFFGCFSSMGLTQAPVPFLEDIGYPTQMAAAAIGMMGVGSAVGKAVFGWLCDRMQPKKAWPLDRRCRLAPRSSSSTSTRTRPSSSSGFSHCCSAWGWERGCRRCRCSPARTSDSSPMGLSSAP